MDALIDSLLAGESARWHDGRLWFAHWGAAEIIVAAPEGGIERRIPVPTKAIPISLDWTPDGRLLVVCGAEGQLLVQGDDGSFSPYADLSALAAKGFNELVVDGRGNAYINGSGFDLMAGEAPVPGIIALVRPDGSVRQVADEIEFPNGMAVTPDNDTLIIAESYGRRLTAFTIGPDGDLAARRVWADLGDGVPDGICVDAESAVWYADVPNRRSVRVREGGEVADTVQLDRGAFSCALGGEDRRTLFIVATVWNGPERMFAGQRDGQLLSAPAPVAGAGWP
jgi:sugar lactone lactonase YvrE